MTGTVNWQGTSQIVKVEAPFNPFALAGTTSLHAYYAMPLSIPVATCLCLLQIEGLKMYVQTNFFRDKMSIKFVEVLVSQVYCQHHLWQHCQLQQGL